MKKKIKIGFTFNLNQNSGPSIFLKRLKDNIAENKLSYVSNIFNPFNDILIFSNKVRNIYNKKYIFRIDGPNVDFSLYRKNNRKYVDENIFNGAQNSSGIIFQSKFCKMLFNKFYKLNKQIRSKIIYNGVDNKIFNENGNNYKKKLGISNQLIFLTSANWRNHKRLQCTINSFNYFKDNFNKKIKLIVIGNIDKTIKGLNKNIIEAGCVKTKYLPMWYRSADIYLFFSWIDYCPNTVVEAISSKLPVLCTNLGGTHELVQKCKAGLILKNDSDLNFDIPFNLNKPPKINIKKAYDKIKFISKNIKEIKQDIDLHNIDINNTSRVYFDFIKNTLD